MEKKNKKAHGAGVASLILGLITPCVFAQEKQVVSSKVDPLLLVRINDHISAVNHLVFDDGQRVNRWDGFDCNTLTAHRLYWETLGDKGEVTRRFYGDSLERYAAAQPDPQLDAVAATLCHAQVKNPEWVYVEKKSRYDTPILIDVNTLIRLKETLIAKIGFDYGEIQYDPPYDAPYSFKIEIHAWHCPTNKDRVLAGLDITPDGYVSDSLIDGAISRRAADFSNTPATNAAFKALCRLPSPAAFTGEGRYIPDTKPKMVSGLSGPMMPDFKDNDPTWINRFPLPAGLENQASALINPRAIPHFKHVRWSQRTPGNEPVAFDIRTLPGGLVLIQEDYHLFKTQRVSVANLLQLKGAVSISYTPSMTDSLNTDLHFPLYRGQTFVASTSSSEPGGKRKHTRSLACRVNDSAEAKTLNSRFTGRYWDIACEENSDGENSKSRYGFLTDLNLFVPLSLQSKGQMLPVTLDHVDIDHE